MKNSKALVNIELCIGCGECVEACPTGALMGKKKRRDRIRGVRLD